MNKAYELPAANAPVERPKLHFTPPVGWMNDPNGLVYYNGEYHLFYQYYPHKLVWGPMHWGHAISTDLIHWEHLDPALYPDEAGMCFSGSAVVDWHDSSGFFDGQPGLVAIYTAHISAVNEGEADHQEQAIAFSKDNGRTWHKYEGNPVIPNPGIQDFRDPKVIWHEPTEQWVMVLACDQCIRFYTSDNLIHWRFTSEFGNHEGAHDSHAWECPDLFELPVEDTEEKRWVLVVGIQDGSYAGGSGTQYFVGHFDGERFINDNPADTVLWMDYGRDFYATQSWSDIPAQDGRRLTIAWMSNWQYANQVPATHWRSSMTLPRELTLVTTPVGIRLKQGFVRELGSLEATTLACVTTPTNLTAGQTLTSERSAGSLHSKLNLTLSPQSTVQLSLHQGTTPDLRLEYDGERLTLWSYRKGSNGEDRYDTHYPHEVALDLGPSPRIELELLADHGSLEVLVNDGLYSLTNLRFTPQPEQPLRLATAQGEAGIERFDCMGLHHRPAHCPTKM